VLVARNDNAGDVLLSGPATRAVAAAAEVTYLCSPRGASAAALLPGVERVVTETLAWIDPDPSALDRASLTGMIDRLAALEVDEAVVLTSFHQSPLPLALALRAAGVGRITAASVDYPGSLLDVRVRADDDLHEVERALLVAAAAGYPAPDGDDRRLALRAPLPVVDGLPERYVVVHPGASVPARAWSPERMAATVTALARAGRAVVVTGAPTEAGLTARVATGLATDPAGVVTDLGGRTDLAQLAAVLAGADAVVVGNTGPAHLAAAVGTAVVSLYAPTVPARRWRPWMVPCRVLGDQAIACAGCRARVCPVAGHPCIDDVPVGAVLAALEELAAAPDREQLGRGRVVA
jgi:ADP-heptose:LPS heptosyltransferase